MRKPARSLTLYHGPGSCSLASYFALAEAQATFNVEIVSTRDESVRSPAHLDRNIWGKVPVLEIDGRYLTENSAILQFVADGRPDLALLPPAGTFERAQANSWLAFLSSTLHIAFRPIFRPERLASSASARQDVLHTGHVSLRSVVEKLNAYMAVRTWLDDRSFSLADAYMAVYSAWLRRPAFEGILTIPEALRAHADRVAARPAIAGVLSLEQRHLAAASSAG